LLVATPEFQIVDADWSHDRAAIQQVRRAVFIEEQGIPETLEWDGRDAACRHVLALEPGGGAIATGRLAADGRIGRMAVLRKWRGRGVGRALVLQLLRQAGHSGLRYVHAHAQMAVSGFYERMGFQITGQPFVTVGIAHVAMVRQLDCA